MSLINEQEIGRTKVNEHYSNYPDNRKNPKL